MLLRYGVPLLAGLLGLSSARAQPLLNDLLRSLPEGARPVPPVTEPVVRRLPPEVTERTAPAPEARDALPVFGASLFSGSNLTFEPNLRIPTPRDYVLGPDDELVVEIYGNARQQYRARISPEGTISLEHLGPIAVSGLTVEAAQQRVIARLRQLYTGLNSPASGIYAQVTLGNIRSIRVTLMGQVVRPGTYTLASLATVFNALYAAGGPHPVQGSFRNIRVYRQNRLVRTLDVYDFLLRADQTDNIRLHDGDVIRIDHPVARVELSGEVRQPGIFEVKAGETLQQVLAFAGGFTERAYRASLTLRRATARELRIETIPSAELATLRPEPGDQYRIGAILDRYANRVRVEGAVFRPGEYALEKAPTLRRLIESADGLREDAFTQRVLIRRMGEDLSPQLVAVDAGRVLRGEEADVALQREDVVVVASKHALQAPQTVGVRGAVNRPGTYPFAEGLTVASLVVQAGGLAEGAAPERIEIARRVRTDSLNQPSGQTVQLLEVRLDTALQPGREEQLLQPFDEVFIRTASQYTVQQGAVVAGEVFYPGYYVIRARQERLADLLRRAGGVRPEAYLPAARLVRKGEGVSVDIRKILDDPTASANLLLEPSDSLYLPRRLELVRIGGQVLNPALVDYHPDKSVRQYLDEAGGFTRQALRRRLYVTYANGKIRRTKQYGFWRRYPPAEPGMTVTVPPRPDANGPSLSPAERLAMTTSLTSLAAVLATLIRLMVRT